MFVKLHKDSFCPKRKFGTVYLGVVENIELKAAIGCCFVKV